ncbi:MAG: 50S ribosomal protein L32 [Chloroflexota bacterium]|nr:50S ribosomal protein L32 [Chloroflexota bacterium]
MPPLPKRKRTKAAKGANNAHNAIKRAAIVDCPHCRRPMMAHRVCPACGHYRGRDVLEIETANT